MVLALLSVVPFLSACSSPKAAAVSVASPSPPIVLTSSVSAPQKSKPSADQSNGYVAAVRGGTVSGYSSATIDNAFDAAFHNPEWRSQQTKESERVVNFTGLLPASARQDCDIAARAHPAVSCTQDAKVTFRWTFSPDGRLFHLSYIDKEPWPEAQRSTRDILLFIFGR